MCVSECLWQILSQGEQHRRMVSKSGQSAANAQCTVEAVLSTPEVSAASSFRCTERRAW